MDYQHDIALGGKTFKLRQSVDLGTPLTEQAANMSVDYVVSMLAYKETAHSRAPAIDKSLSVDTVLGDTWLAHLLTSRKLPNWGVTHKPKSALVVGSQFGQLVQFWKHSLAPFGKMDFPVHIAESDYLRALVAQSVIGTNEIRGIVDGNYSSEQYDGGGHVVIWKDVQAFDESTIRFWNSALAPGNILLLHGRDLKGAYSRLPKPLNLEHYFHGGQILYAGQLEGETEMQFALAVKT